MITQAAMWGKGIGTCEICGRTLSNPASVQAHIGPICAGKRHRGDAAKASEVRDAYPPIPIEEGFILQRTEVGVATNVRHTVVHHSTTGYEFGYGGSGPADLALNILEAALRSMGHHGRRTACYDGSCYSVAWMLHQEFKFEFVSTAGRAGCVIPYADVVAWISEHMRDEGLDEREEA